MTETNKKGVTVKVDAALHAEIRQYLDSHGMTMSEFISKAVEEWLHPPLTEKEGYNMGNTRTIAVQVPEDLFQRIKEYLQRNNMTQRQFLIGLIEDELERDMQQRVTAADLPNADADDSADNGRERFIGDEPEDEPEAEPENDGMEMSM